MSCTRGHFHFRARKEKLLNFYTAVGTSTSYTTLKEIGSEAARKFENQLKKVTVVLSGQKKCFCALSECEFRPRNTKHVHARFWGNWQ